MTRYIDSLDWQAIAKDREQRGLSMRRYLQSGRLQMFMPPEVPLPSFKTFARYERRARTQADAQTIAADRAVPVYSFTEQQVRSVLEVRTSAPEAAKRSVPVGSRHQVRVRLPRDVSVEIDCDNPEMLLLKTLAPR